MNFTETEVFNFKGALRGMRNPKESWHKSDSFPLTYDGKNANLYQGVVVGYHIGENDLELAQKLIIAGKEHSKFMRQIIVSVDITAPLFWWKEFDTYKVGTVANSTSTMHKLASTPITLDCFEIGDFNSIATDECGTKWELGLLSNLIPWLDELRVKYLDTNDKKYWKELIRWLPESWLQTRTVTMSYANLRDMIKQRSNHKLSEWSVDFINWCKTLPYASELLFI